MTRDKTAIALAIVLLALAPAAASAQERLVGCSIDSDGKRMFDGRCRYIPDQGGSFALAHANPNRPLYGRILSISVFIVSPGVAEVRGLTDAGNNSRWGEARRSRQDAACWVGSDFTVCAR